MKLSSEQFLFTSALDVRRRFVRLCSLLSQAKDSATSSKGLLIDSLLQLTKETLKQYVEAVSDIYEGALILMGDKQRPWDEESRIRLAAATYNGYEAFRYKHDEAYTYISEYVSVPNDLMHFLFRALHLSLVSNTHRDSVALYPSRFLMWESASSERNPKNPTGSAAILVPYSETTTPMRWPLLVHELAHHLSPGGANSDLERDRVWEGVGEKDRARLDDGLKELQADSIAEDAAGPTYAVALARESSLILNDQHLRKGGPTVKQRLEYLKYGKEVAEAIPKEWHLDGSSLDLGLSGENEGLGSSKLAKAGSETNARIHSQAEATHEVSTGLDNQQLEALINLADNLRGERKKSSPSKMIERVLSLKKEGDPIPAVPRHNTLSQNDFLTISEADQNTKEGKEAIRKLFLSLSDVPLSDADILEAVWTEEFQMPSDDVLKKLLASTDDKSFIEEMAELDSQDVLLSRSLQVAAVHNWLIENDPDIKDAVAEDEPDVPIPEAPKDAKPLEESSPLSDIQLARRLTLPAGHDQRLVVRPLIDPGQVGGTTIDLRLGTEWETLKTSRFRSLDPSDNSSVVTDLLNYSVEEFRLTAAEAQGLVLHPGELLLALTLEYLRLPKDIWGQLEGRSTWARVGLQVHATAGMVDAGFEGFLTLELQNTGRLPIVLYPGLRVAQMAFFPVANIARPYNKKPGSAYANQAKVRTAFTHQHEHQARHKFMERERNEEQSRIQEARNQVQVDPDAR